MRPCTTCGLGKGDHTTYLGCIKDLKQVVGGYKAASENFQRRRISELDALVQALIIRVSRLEEGK